MSQNQKSQQSQAPQAQTEIVPERRKLKEFPTISHSDKLRMENPNDGFVRRYFSTNPEHPTYIGKFNIPHMIGDSEVGYLSVQPWRTCDGNKIKQEIARPDQGGFVDSLVKRGRSILCELSQDEYDKYDFIRNKRKVAKANRLQNGIDNYRSTGVQAVSSTRIMRGDPRLPNQVPGDHRSLINQHQ